MQKPSLGYLIEVSKLAGGWAAIETGLGQVSPPPPAGRTSNFAVTKRVLLL
jgi:hypothetical protein